MIQQGWRAAVAYKAYWQSTLGHSALKLGNPEMIESLDRTTPTWVSEDMCRVLFAAAEALPEGDLDLYPPDFLEYGFALFGLLGECFHGTPTEGLYWWRGPNDYDLPPEQQMPTLLAIAMERKGEDRCPGCVANIDDEFRYSTRLATALIMLADQRLVHATTEQLEPVSRQERRAWEREGKEPPLVTIITLRRRVRENGDQPDEAGFVDWSHRWMVGGHWRQHYYPSDGTHRLIFISPYIKGPEDKPLVVKDRVVQLVR